MARINTNVASMTAQLGLSNSHAALSTTLQRLSTGLRINTGADDPAGLIASEGLKSEVAGIQQAVDNSTRANNVLSTADGALGEVSSLLLNIKSLVVQAANTGAMTPDEISANQLQLDSAVQSITRISNTTNFDGLRLLDGSMNYITSGVSKTAITSLNIAQTNFGTHPTVPVQVNVTTSAQQAMLEFKNSAAPTNVTLEVAGNNGVQTLTFVKGTSASAIAYAINGISDSTGVTATMNNATNITSGISLHSSGFGSKSFVSVSAQSGTFTTVDAGGAQKSRSTGRDAIATVNGNVTTGDGLKLQVSTDTLDMSMTLGQNFGAGQTSFTITGGGAMFQLGAQVTTNQQVNLGIQSVAASDLGDSTTGFLNSLITGGAASLVAGNTADASRIIEKAINQVSVLRGRLGAFEKNTLSTNITSLNAAMQNVTASESAITDADFAKTTSEMTRDQILVQAGTSVLSTANSTPQSVLSLLK